MRIWAVAEQRANEHANITHARTLTQVVFSLRLFVKLIGAEQG